MYNPRPPHTNTLDRHRLFWGLGFTVACCQLTNSSADVQKRLVPYSEEVALRHVPSAYSVGQQGTIYRDYRGFDVAFR